MGGEGVAQAMRVPDDAAQRRRVEAPAAGGQEQCVLGAARELRPRVAQVPGDEERSLFAERDDAVLAALPLADVHALLFEVDVAEVEPDRLRGAQAARVDDLDQSRVAKTERPVDIDALDQLLHLSLL